MSGSTQQSVKREWQWFLFSLSCVAVTALLANEVVGKLGQWKHEPTYREIAVKALHEKHPEIVVVGS